MVAAPGVAAVVAVVAPAAGRVIVIVIIIVVIVTLTAGWLQHHDGANRVDTPSSTPACAGGLTRTRESASRRPNRLSL